MCGSSPRGQLGGLVPAPPRPLCPVAWCRRNSNPGRRTAARLRPIQAVTASSRLPPGPAPRVSGGAEGGAAPLAPHCAAGGGAGAKEAGCGTSCTVRCRRRPVPSASPPPLPVPRPRWGRGRRETSGHRCGGDGGCPILPRPALPASPILRPASRSKRAPGATLTRAAKSQTSGQSGAVGRRT